MKTWEKGAANTDSAFLIAIVVLIILSWIHLGAVKVIQGKNPASPFAVTFPATSNSSGSYGSSGTTDTTDSSKSPWFGQITIDAGNAASEYEPYQEYIILHGSGSITKSINISGWRLVNAKNARAYQIGSNVTRFESDVAIIPQAVPLYIPGKGSITAPILLPANGQAVVITGVNNYNGVPLPSFHENKCIPYLTADKKNPLTIYPGTYGYCPAPMKEVGVSGLDNACNQFVSNLGYCRTPNFIDSVRTNGYLEPGYVDGVGGLSQSCKDYLQNHYNYNACVANHSTDPDFYVSTWHVYLSRKWEMWATERETITLLDSDGKIVDRYSY